MYIYIYIYIIYIYILLYNGLMVTHALGQMTLFDNIYITLI